MKQKVCLLIFSLLSFIVNSTVTIGLAAAQTNAPPDAETSESPITKMRTRSALEKEAYRLAEQGYLDEAMAKFQEAMKSEYWTYDWEVAVAKGGIAEILKMQGRYEQALDARQWHLKLNPEKYEPDRRELMVLIQYQKDGDAEPIYAHIEYLKNVYPHWMPPNGYSEATLVYIVDILRLYSTIGDHDAGIRFINDCLEYFKQDDIKRYGEYRPGSGDQAYLEIREAFEQDKAEGFQGCAGKKPGEVCMGRATKALIQSDYFSW